MARSTAKVILFSKHVVGKIVHQWPTAVFNDLESAKSYATMIKMAHASGDVKTAQTLDPQTPVTEDGKLHDGIKFSIKEVPYAPAPTFADGDLFEGEAKPTE